MSEKDLKSKQTTSSPSGQQRISADKALAIAEQHLSAGRLSDAANVYQLVLQSDPTQVVALHFLGVVAHQMGRSETAVDLIKNALTIAPDYFAAHNNLGNVYIELGELDEAVACYREAVAV